MHWWSRLESNQCGTLFKRVLYLLSYETKKPFGAGGSFSPRLEPALVSGQIRRAASRADVGDACCVVDETTSRRAVEVGGETGVEPATS